MNDLTKARELAQQRAQGAIMSTQSKKEKDLLLALEMATAGLAVIANNYPEAKNFALFNLRKAREAINAVKRRQVRR